MANSSEHEKLIEQYMSEGNTEPAVQLLSELIIKAAREKNFEQAEASAIGGILEPYHWF